MIILRQKEFSGWGTKTIHNLKRATNLVKKNKATSSELKRATIGAKNNVVEKLDDVAHNAHDPFVLIPAMTAPLPVPTSAIALASAGVRKGVQKVAPSYDNAIEAVGKVKPIKKAEDGIAKQLKKPFQGGNKKFRKKKK